MNSMSRERSRRGQAGGSRMRNGADHSQSKYATPSPSRQGPRHGHIAADVWRKAVRASVHQLRTPRAWALDVADLEAAEFAGVESVCVRDLETLREFWATPATIRSRGFELDRGHGRQVALVLEHWAPSHEDLVRLGIPSDGPRPSGHAASNAPTQLSLFGRMP